MLTLRVLWRFLVLNALFGLPSAAVGAVGFGLRGVITGAVLVTAGLVFVLLAAERIVIRGFEAAELPTDIGRSFEFFFLGPDTRPPRLLVRPDSTPNVLVARSLGKPGVILISQGAIALLNEDEVGAILHGSRARLKDPEVYLRSVCAVLSLTLRRTLPRAWSELLLSAELASSAHESQLSPWSSIPCLIFYPWLRFLTVPERKEANLRGGDAEAFLSASRKVLRVTSERKRQPTTEMNTLMYFPE